MSPEARATRKAIVVVLISALVAVYPVVLSQFPDGPPFLVSMLFGVVIYAVVRTIIEFGWPCE